MLEVNDIHVTYGRLRALKGVSLSVRQGEIVCLIGPNGAGKSTTLAAIAGGVVPHRGTMLLDGKPLAAGRPEQTARLGVSLVPEGRHVFGTLTVAENLRVATYMRRDRAAVAADYERVLALFPRLKERHRQPRRPALRRRAADAGDRPRPAHPPAPAAGRRAFARPRARRSSIRSTKSCWRPARPRG